jgi:hypothetical protein
VRLAAPAAHRVHLMLLTPGGHQGHLDLLVDIGHPQVGGLAQVPPAALAFAFGPVRDPLIRSLRPVQAEPLGALSPPRPRWLSLPRRGAGGVRPGSSSLLGGTEELPEFRDTRRSRRPNRAASSVFSRSSSAIRAA